MSRIFITGDIHRELDIDKLYMFHLAENLTKEDYLIIAGDVGVSWHGKDSVEDTRIREIYESFPWTTIWVDGNHENFNELEKFPIEVWNGGLVHRLGEKLIHLMRGQVFTIDDLKFFTMGGAASIDKYARRKDISWWEQELPTQKEYETALENLEKNSNEVDYVISHCCKRELLEEVCGRPFLTDELNSFFSFLENVIKLKFKHWYFGHYHIDKQLDNTHTCLYDNILQIK